MSRVGIRAALLALGLLCTAYSRAADAWSWTYRTLVIVGDTDEQLVSVANEIARNSALRDRALCDVIAEKIWRMRAAKSRSRTAAAQLALIVANCPDAGRYFAVLRVMRSYLPKAAEHVFSAYDQRFRKPGDDPFVPGSVDLDALEREYVAAALAVQPTAEQAQALLTLPANATLEEMFAVVGVPAGVAAREVKSEAQVAVELRQVWFYYRGIGRVIFDYQHRSGWRQLLVVMDPMAFESKMPYRARTAELNLPDDATVAFIQLMSGSPSSIKASAQDVYRMEVAPPGYLEAAAEVLLRNHAEAANTGANDAYAWLCSVLAHHGGPHYQRVLGVVRRTTNDEKLQRFAKQPVDRGDPGLVADYVPGSISLDELARKYPSLYPGMTLMRGVL
jgi:hypothetical protein